MAKRIGNGLWIYEQGEDFLVVTGYCPNEVYDKSEADSYIRLLDSHQKYKRCLARAQEWRNYASFWGIQSSWHNHRGFGKTAEKYTWKEIHAWKCVKHYKELAEKFKTNATAQ